MQREQRLRDSLKRRFLFIVTNINALTMSFLPRRTTFVQPTTTIPTLAFFRILAIVVSSSRGTLRRCCIWMPQHSFSMRLPYLLRPHERDGMRRECSQPKGTLRLHCRDCDRPLLNYPLLEWGLRRPRLPWQA